MNRLPSVPEHLSRNVVHLPIWSFFSFFGIRTVAALYVQHVYAVAFKSQGVE